LAQAILIEVSASSQPPTPSMKWVPVGNAADTAVAGRHAEWSPDAKACSRAENAKVVEEEKMRESGKGAKGKGKGPAGKASGKGQGGKHKGKGPGKGGKEDAGARTAQEVEAEMAQSKAPPPVAAQQWTKRGPENVSKQPVDTKGSHCEVRKHSGMGCAVVSLDSYTVRETIMTHIERKYGGDRETPPKMQISDVTVQIRRHTDKATKREVVTDLFVAWGHKQEKETPLPCDDIVEAFDILFKEAHGIVLAEAMPTSPSAGAPARQAPAAMACAPSPGIAQGAPYTFQQQTALAMCGGQPVAPGQPAFQMAPQQYMPAYYQQQQQHQQQFAYQQQLAYQQHQMRQMQQMQFMQQQQHQQQMMQMQPQTLPGAVVGQAPPPQAQPAPQQPAEAEGSRDAPESAAATAGTAKPKIMPIVDPATGKSIDMLHMNFELRKPRSPIAIIDPMSGQPVTA